MLKFFSVAVLGPPFSTLTYQSPDWLPADTWRPGQLALIPLGRQARLGVILEETSAPKDLALKNLLWPVGDQALFNAEYLKLVHELALRQVLSPGRIFDRILPQDLREGTRARLRVFTGHKPYLYKLSELAKLSRAELAELGQAKQAGRLETVYLSQDLDQSEICSLNCDPPWPVKPNAARQREVLDYLLAHGQQSRQFLRKALPAAYPALDGLIKNRLIRIEALPEQTEQDEALLPPLPAPYTLTQDQSRTLRELEADLFSGVSRTKLLYGVTGSGKTAVYLELAAKCLAEGKSALLLAPEVALALKLYRESRERFPEAAVILYHGYQNPLRRSELFRDLSQRQQACLIVGTRSALFLPMPPLGLIVLDEEHDASFKQDESFTYQAKEVAWQRAGAHGALLLLASATPDLKTFHAAKQGHLPVLCMPSRVGAAILPAIELVGIKDKEVLAPASLELLRETLRKGEQAVILLNRRGYSPLMYCLDCAQVARCPNCDISLTYHKKREQLVCHYCGQTKPFPSPCTNCGSLHFHPMGEGTERLEERLLSEELAQAAGAGSRILRLDRDSTSRQGKLEEILTAFARKESQVLIGTQMLSKGHHFPDVTLVIIADADLGLHLPDYRSAERVFQLLIQAAGRAGRGNKAGRVLIQTRDTRHYCWQYVQNADYEGFYEQEIALRAKRLYPPFVKLGLIRFSFTPDKAQGMEKIREFAAILRLAARQSEVMVLGPAPAPLAKLKGRLRYQCLLKAGDWPSLRKVYAQAIHKSKLGSDRAEIRISLDLDPVNML